MVFADRIFQGLHDEALKLAAQFSPENTLIAADMTGTVLHQRPAGFPEAQRVRIRGFLEGRGLFVLVTGDSYTTVLAEFAEPLAWRGAAPLYLITGAGYRVDAVRGGEFSNIYTGRVFSPEALNGLVNIVERICRDHANSGFRFSAGERRLLTEGEGHRIEAGPAMPELGERCYLEIIPNKCTVFFPDTARPSGRAARLLDALTLDPEAARLAAGHGGHVIRNNNSVDIILSLKEDGLRALFRNCTAFSASAQGRDAVVLGDSRNDEGLLSFPFENAGRVLRGLVGEDDRFYADLGRKVPAGELFYLKGRYTDGLGAILDRIDYP